MEKLAADNLHWTEGVSQFQTSVILDTFWDVV
jgi:hypothetical protein